MMDSESHFDEIARQYDYWKGKNWYYYQNLKALLGSQIPSGSSVLEVGCGTGDLLAALKPSHGLGIDISDGMVRLAEKKHADESALEFKRIDILQESIPAEYEYVFMSDVLEHVEDNQVFMSRVKLLMAPHTKLIVTLANPLWEPVLMVAEKLGMKMPEGPHKRLTIRQLENIFDRAGFKLESRGYRLLVPKKLPFSDFINARFHRSGFLARLGFIVFWVLRTK